MPLLPHIVLETAPNPRHSIIWLHGLGADGNDFVPIADEMSLPVPVRYLFPHAPMRPVTINGGYVMRAWYDILVAAASAKISASIGKEEDADGLRSSQTEIEKLIAAERQRGVAAKNIFLAGFSQGGAVALYTGLRHPERLGGILALSSYLPLAGATVTEAHASNEGIDIFMAHGHSDDIIPYEFGKASSEALSRMGYATEWHGYNMPHSVCPEEIVDIEAWLISKLAS